MEYLIYISTAKYLLSDDELMDIYTISRLKNKLYDITGILLYAQGTFIQFLEGSAQAVEHIFGAIIKDDRHKNIIKLAHEAWQDRAFSEWLMGFSCVEKEKFKDLDSYFDGSSHKLEKHPHPGVKILNTFLESHP